MNNLIKIITTTSILLGVSHNALADFTSYDLASYGQESQTSNNDEYIGTNFWSHYYWYSSRDNAYSTHSGIDYGTAENNNNIIYCFGFGKVTRTRTAYGQVSVRHLVNTGAYFIVNLLHSSGIDSAVSENNYIAKKQFVGIKDGIGADGTVAFAKHLHLEVSDSENLSIPLTDNAHPGPGDLRPSDPALAKGGLIAHYVGTDPAIRYFNPNVFAATKREAIPFLSRTAVPTESSYDVYGIANKTIYGHLDLNGTFHRSSIVVRDFFSRSQVENQGGLDDAHRFLGGVNLDSQVNGIEGENIYQEGDYLFVAYVNDNDEHRFGYPVKFSFVPEGSIIVDNDQQNADSDSGNDSVTEPAYNGSVGSKVPGYFLTADLHTGRSGAFAQWKPYQSGRYEIYVHIPEYGATATNAVFKIIPDGQNPVYADGIDMANSSGQWVQIKNGDKSIFDFTEKGYVGISLSNDPSSSNYHIDESQKISFDAVKFKKVGNLTTDTLSFFPIVLSGKFFLIPSKKSNSSVIDLNNFVFYEKNGNGGKHYLENNSLILEVTGGSNGYMGIMDRYSVKLQGISLTDKTIEFNIHELERIQHNGYKENVSFYLYLSDGVSKNIGIRLNGRYSGYHPDYDGWSYYSQYYGHRLYMIGDKDHKWSLFNLMELSPEEYYDMDCRVINNNNEYKICYKDHLQSNYTCVSPNVPFASSAPMIVFVADSGDGGFTYENGSGKFKVDYFRIKDTVK